MQQDTSSSDGENSAAQQPAATSPHGSTLPSDLKNSILVAYRSIGIGTFGVVMRYAGMPLEKIALYMNSSQVTGKHQFRQSIKLTFEKGMLAPYKVVGPASLVAWFMQYSVMGLAFQFFDHALSKALGVKPVIYGDELMEPPPSSLSNDNNEHNDDPTYRIKSTTKTILAPILAGSLESIVANRAEVQRYYGPTKLAAIESHLKWNPIARACGPSYVSNAARNVIMCNMSFIITPITYKYYYPQEKKSQGSLFWFGMGMNFVGNAVAITQQALWGRALDYAVFADGSTSTSATTAAAATGSTAKSGGQQQQQLVARNISYAQVIKSSLAKDGISAFFTVPKWASRILMNAPVQGSLPWFYNNVLPLGEESVLGVVRTLYGDNNDQPSAADNGNGNGKNCTIS